MFEGTESESESDKPSFSYSDDDGDFGSSEDDDEDKAYERTGGGRSGSSAQPQPLLSDQLWQQWEDSRAAAANANWSHERAEALDLPGLRLPRLTPRQPLLASRDSTRGGGGLGTDAGAAEVVLVLESVPIQHHGSERDYGYERRGQRGMVRIPHLAWRHKRRSDLSTKRAPSKIGSFSSSSSSAPATSSDSDKVAVRCIAMASRCEPRFGALVRKALAPAELGDIYGRSKDIEKMYNYFATEAEFVLSVPSSSSSSSSKGGSRDDGEARDSKGSSAAGRHHRGSGPHPDDDDGGNDNDDGDNGDNGDNGDDDADMTISVRSKDVKLGSLLVLDTRVASRSPSVRVAMLECDSQTRLLAYLRSLLHRDVGVGSDSDGDDCGSNVDEDDDNAGGRRGRRMRKR